MAEDADTNGLDFLDCIANELIRRSVSTAGTVFVNKQPGKPNDCVSLFGLPGSTVQQQRDVPGLQFPRFQLVVRANDYNDASDMFQAVRNVLHGIIGLNLPYSASDPTGEYIRVMRCHLDYEGGPLGEDDQGRAEFSANFIAEYHFYEAPAP